MKKPRLALVYDRINKFGGAERILLALHKIWPEAPLFTAVYHPEKAGWAKEFKVVSSFLQRFPLAKSYHEIYPWLTPMAFESFDFFTFDIVISVTSAEAKGIITKPQTLHVCYCLTPTRYLWSGYDFYKKSQQFGFFNILTKPLFLKISQGLRQGDKIASQRPDYYLAISQEVKKRIKKYYHRDSEVIYPSVDTNKFSKSTINNQQLTTNNYFLVVSRLVPYKRIDLAVKAFNRLGLALKIVGVGSELGRLKRIARKNIEFLGELTDDCLIRYYQKCVALIFPGEEDFGLAPIEAQAAGKPVIALRKGGVKETVIEGKTGIFFERQTVESLARAVLKFQNLRFSNKNCWENAKKFDQQIFIKKFKSLVEEKWQKHQKRLTQK